MAPNGWKVSDWQRVRLAAYVLAFRGVTVYRGDQRPIGRDLTLGHLRDSYYQAKYGTLALPNEPSVPGKVPTARKKHAPTP